MKLSYFNSILLFFFIIGISNYNYSQNLLLSKNAKVSIITCDTGNESYSLFGHTAIRIFDLENNFDIVYNYGAFDFSTPNFVAKFSKGDLQYFVVSYSFTDFLNQYSLEQRSVYEQELNIDLAYKQKLFNDLNIVVSTDQRFYTYKFIDKNCTSMVVEMINKTLGNNVIVKKFDTDITYRSILYPYFDDFFYDKLGTSIIFGNKVDQLGSKIFLPLELKKSLSDIQFKNQSLCSESKTLLNFEKRTNTSWWNNNYSFLIFLVLIIVVNKKSTTLFYLSIMGILGLFFGFMGFYSLHQELTDNYNIALFNPSLLILAYFYLKNNKKWTLNLCVFNFISVLVYFILVFNKAHFFIVLPLIATSCIILLIIRKTTIPLTTLP